VLKIRPFHSILCYKRHNAIREVAMANQSQPFRQHHVTRLLKAQSDAGVRDPFVKIRLPNGTEYHVGTGQQPDAVLKPGKTSSSKKPVGGRK
jgi:hypothetical protein